MGGNIIKKIGLLLNSTPYGGGTFQYNQTMVDALSKLDKNKYQTVIVYTKELWKPYINQYNIPAVFLSERSISYRRKLLRSFLKRLRIFKMFFPSAQWEKLSVNPDLFKRNIVRMQCDLWIFPSQDAFSYLLPVPALSTIHDLMHRYENFPEVLDDGEFEMREILYSNMCKFSKGILVDSEVGRQHVNQCYDKNLDDIFVLPFIAPKYIYEYDETTSAEIIKKYKLPDKYIFYPAQFWKHKNHENLIKGLHIAKNKIADIQLVLVGSPKNGYESVRNLVDSLKLTSHVHFLGYVSDSEMSALYRRARAMIMPTFFGPTNIPPLEGFASGCPVAISNKYGMPEQVKDAALLFNPVSIEEISEVIIRLWTDDSLCLELINRGFAINKEWGQPEFNKQLEEIIEKILS